MFFSGHGTPGWVEKLGKRERMYHFLADHGQRQFTWDKAVSTMSGGNADYSKRDMWSAIEKGEQISWAAHVQIMRLEEADPGTQGGCMIVG
ncbi:catalase [[Emmonsia] crescens]|uniref:Catalase n=1 Tax=[Emmonsia] crescens TaxID=73230 RepID=A0A0G2IAH1_9EURO|nr:catalase [Emmonsia crescens UAMH 3008]